MLSDGPNGFVPDPRITEYPGTMIRDWIMLCPDIPDSAYRAYSIIRAHIWEKDVRREVHLTQAQISEMLRKSEDRTRKILKPLLAVGLLAVAEKREWWEYNPRLNRRERRTMNIYAVTDFPSADYEGPRSISDFKARFAEQAKADRSKTTGRGAPNVSAGQADRSKTTDEPTSQVSDVSAGQADRSKTTSDEVENNRPYKNPYKKEGEEGVARAREADSPSPDDEPQWGVAGGRRSARPTLADADVITDLARQVLAEGEALSADEHQELAGQVRAVRPVVEAQPGLSWAEYEAWLSQGWLRADGRPAYKIFSRALSWRLRPEQVRDHAWVWACQRRGAQEESEARGTRAAPERRKEHEQRCGRHDTTLLDGRCVLCDEEEREAEAQRRADEEAAAATEDYVEYTDDDVADIGIDPALQEQMMRDLQAREEKSAAAKEDAMKKLREKFANN